MPAIKWHLQPEGTAPKDPRSRVGFSFALHACAEPHSPGFLELKSFCFTDFSCISLRFCHVLTPQKCHDVQSEPYNIRARNKNGG
jgi:hypothetical protein